MEYFAGLDVSMAETHVCVVTRNGAVIHQAKVPSTRRYRRRACASADLPAGPIRDGPNGSDALPWFDPTWVAPGCASRAGRLIRR